MKLLQFRVTNFRSVKDSGWISTDDVTTLVGINESGKSNILLALWKLNPASGGDIDPVHDLPVSRMAELRSKLAEVQFIEAEFCLADSAEELSNNLGINFLADDKIRYSRFYDGHWDCSFVDNQYENELKSLLQDEEDEDGNTIPAEYTEDEIKKVFIDVLTPFVYYSNYGNLSSRIYLPYAIKWLKGNSVPGIDVSEDQVRTLSVLFEYVNLKPEEIQELGKDAEAISGRQTATEKDIQKEEKSKEERALLLQSAGNQLTRDFREWWKQGEYKFRFSADGDYFQIWVSDDKRPEEVSLELRSTGLQWFLSFYLIFLVESQRNNKGAILLLDEAGLTLHPLAQKDLCAFFNKLSEENQLINTTHSPFIIDTENIDRCRVVYLDENGNTVVSEDLRAGSGEVGKKSVYAVHAALGLTVSDIMLQGSQVVIVEGTSDQYYLSAIKAVLIREGKIKPRTELVFAPAGGVKGIGGITSVISSKSDELPFVVLDSDKSGEAYKAKLIGNNGLYQGAQEKIISIKDFTDMENSEVEDLIPGEIIDAYIDKLFKDEEDEFECDSSQPVVPQIEMYANEHKVALPSGWKVELAKEFKKQALSNRSKKKSILQERIKQWTSLFERFLVLEQ